MQKINEKKLYMLLEKTGLLDDFTQNKLKCANCEVVLNEENLGYIINQKYKPILYCNKQKCTAAMKTNHSRVP